MEWLEDVPLGGWISAGLLVFGGLILLGSSAVRVLEGDAVSTNLFLMLIGAGAVVAAPVGLRGSAATARLESAQEGDLDGI